MTILTWTSKLEPADGVALIPVKTYFRLLEHAKKRLKGETVSVDVIEIADDDEGVPSSCTLGTCGKEEAPTQVNADHVVKSQEIVVIEDGPDEAKGEAEEDDYDDDGIDDQALVEAAEQLERQLENGDASATPSWLETAAKTARSIQTDIAVYFGLQRRASAPPAAAAPPPPPKPALKRRFWSERGTQSSARAEGQEPPKRKCPFYKWIPDTGITVDAFSYGQIENCEAYILTHFHSDHYSGLGKSFSGKVYCRFAYASEVTAALVAMRLYVPQDRIVAIPMERPTVIANVRVTLLDANHCPGAAVVLFELPNGTTYLHTGDFRATPALAAHPVLAGVRIDALFLDTTYCDEQYKFPAQAAVVDKGVALAVAANLSARRLLVLVGAYLIGKERMFAAIAEALGSKIWADATKRRILGAIQMSNVTQRLTDSRADASVHVVDMGSLSLPKLTQYLVDNPGFTDLLAIRPTGWTHTQGSAHLDALKPQKRGNVTLYGLPYSEHSSYSELKQYVMLHGHTRHPAVSRVAGSFVQTVRPRKVIPTVNVGSPAKRNQMNAYFKVWMEDAGP